MNDPYATLGVCEGASPDAVRSAYRALVREHHPDGYPDASEAERAERHERMAAITAAFRMLNDPKELERHRRLERRRQRGTASSTPGADGVHFTAGTPAAGGAVEPAPGDPDFDYRSRAASEFTVRAGPLDPTPWTAARRPNRLRRR